MKRAQNIIVYDLETKYSFDDVGGREAFEKLGISVLGSYDYLDHACHIYEEGELSQFLERLQKKPLLIGFNSRRFDTPILQTYSPFDLSVLTQLDLMEEMVKVLGHRVSLDSCAQATLSRAKTGNGLDALRYYRSGEMEKLKKYCLEDVKITCELFEYGAAHGEIFYTPKFGTGKARAPVTWKVAHPNETEETERQQSLF
ncbi:MAG: ribonuclease H-like domain-containing protein [Deltaproteobacteria bacterium]|nr:ribonuclease H-like domain-containing protein [Deltaproteobacteria bacterium]